MIYYTIHCKYSQRRLYYQYRFTDEDSNERIVTTNIIPNVFKIGIASSAVVMCYFKRKS